MSICIEPTLGITEGNMAKKAKKAKKTAKTAKAAKKTAKKTSMRKKK
jgi:hypothetical protein